MYRILINILLLFFLKISPIWLFCVALLVFAWFFTNPVEIVLFGLLIDVWYRAQDGSNKLTFVYFVVMILVYVALNVLKKNVRK